MSDIPDSDRRIGVEECKGLCGSVESVGWCITDLVIKVNKMLSYRRETALQGAL